MEDSTLPPQMAMMPWYPADFMASTRTWPLIARAVYRELLDAQWSAGGIPDDEGQLRAMLGATPKDWRLAWSYARPKFKPGDDGLLRNARLEQHRCKALELYKSRRKGAAKTNSKRWGTVIPLHADGDSA